MKYQYLFRNKIQQRKLSHEGLPLSMVGLHGFFRSSALQGAHTITRICI
jgi:hypothetical protein